MGSWGEIFATSALQESHSYQDHIFPLDSVLIQSQLRAKQALGTSQDSPSSPKIAHPL